MSSLLRPFVPAAPLAGPHAQTLWSGLLLRPPAVATRPERLELPDGDFLDLAWLDGPRGAPLVVVLHGMQGSIASPYARVVLAGLLEVEDGRAVEEHRGCPQVQLDEDRLGREPRATGRHQDPHAGLLGTAQRGQGGRAHPLAPVEQGAVEVEQEGVAGALHGRSIGLPPVQTDPCQQNASILQESPASPLHLTRGPPSLPA